MEVLLCWCFAVPRKGDITKYLYFRKSLRLIPIQNSQDRCTGMTQRDVIGREVGGGFMFGNACKPMVDSCQCMAKPIQHCKVK